MTSPQPRPSIAQIPPYVAGKPPAPRADLTTYKLSSNENPYPPLPGVVEAALGAVQTMNRYPDMGSTALYEALSAKLGVPTEELALATGSVGLIYQLVQAFCDPDDEVVFAWRSFEAYPIAVTAAAARMVRVPVLADGRHDLDAMVEAVTDRTRVVLVCTPNNPTGPAVTQAELDAFLEKIPPQVLVVVDEAYVEFVRMADPVDGVATYRRHENVLLTRTFSKAYGLAGFRVGYAVGPEARQPVGLGEGPGEQHVLVAAVGRDAVDGVGHPDELDVRLVDHDQHLRRDLLEERVELGLRHGRSGGVVGGADQHDAGAVGDGLDHRVEVVAAIGEHGDADHAGCGGGDGDGV